MNESERAAAVRSWFEGSGAAPLSLQINPTMSCNLNCLFCRRQDQLPRFYKDFKELSDEKYLEMIAEAVAMGVKNINIKGGGEPLIRHGVIEQLVPIIKRGRVSASLITNGTQITASLADCFVKNGWDEISISLDAPRAEIHDHLRDKKDTFRRVLEGLEMINAAKGRHKTGSPTLKFHSVLTTLNIELVHELVELAARHRVAEVELDSMNPNEPSSHPLILTERDVVLFQDRIPELISLAARLGVRNNFENFRRREYATRTEQSRRDLAPVPESVPRHRTVYDDIPCFFPWFHCDITPDGSIVPCCYGEGYVSEGNLHRLSFKEAWRGGGMEEYRSRIRKGTMNAFCKSCTACFMDQNKAVRSALRKEAAVETA
ncbi:MAG TPA: radical SAM protein [Elusimicrobiota bacterium]|nr:radical SAM protein [Elusimicrobiota bacterium]